MDDVDGDGDLDIAVAGALVSILRNDGEGVFSVDMIYPLVTDGIHWWMTTGDLNGDENPDIAVVNGDCHVSVFLNQGGGAFAADLATFRC